MPRGITVRAEKLRELPDDVFEVRIVVWPRFRHLDHVKKITGHELPPFLEFIVPPRSPRIHGNDSAIVTSGTLEAVSGHQLDCDESTWRRFVKMSWNRTLAVSLALAILVVGAAGCTKKITQVTSPWPVANREREAEPPPRPLQWPFTGAKAASRAELARRPLSIKIENSPASRPQTGLNSADVVYETISEGGITRFNCIFHSTIPPRIGPVRSARLSDLWIVPQYDALFFFSGASTSTNARIREAKLPNLSQDAGVAAPYSRSAARSAPHNLYLSTSKAYLAAKAKGLNVTAKPVPLLYLKRTRDETVTITQITIPFSQANTVRWTYDRSARTYSRENNGARHIDEATGRQVTSNNVVVMWADYRPVSHDKAGSTTFQVKLGGKGRVSVFRGGQRFDGTWIADRETPPRFVDAKGRPIKLAVGRTWFQVIPLNGSITMK